MNHHDSQETSHEKIFTARELDVMACILCIEGKNTPSKDIARQLSMSRKRVDSIIHNIFVKIQGSSRYDITVYIESSNLSAMLHSRYYNLPSHKENGFFSWHRITHNIRSGLDYCVKHGLFVSKLALGLLCFAGGTLWLTDYYQHRHDRETSHQLPRAELIHQIDTALTPGLTVALVGPGGIGKTTLARLYANQSKTKLVWEVNAETTSCLVTSFVALAERLVSNSDQKEELARIQKQNEPESVRNLIAFVYKLLQDQPSWLLVFDNVDDLGVLRQFIPQQLSQQGRVLITTRDQNIQNSPFVSSVIRIEELKPYEAYDLFIKLRPSKEHSKTIRTFVNQLPPFPLDISLAAHYIRDAHLSFDQYLKRLNAHQPTFHLHEKKLWSEVSDYPQTRYAIIALTVEKLLELNPDYIGFLQILAVIDSQNIPVDLFRHTQHPEIVDAFIHDLRKFSFVTHELNPFGHHVFFIHRSTQDILNHTLKTKNGDHDTHMITLSLIRCAQHAMEEGDALTIQKLVPHFEAISYVIDDMSFQTTLGMLYYHTGQYVKAQHIFEIKLSVERNKKEVSYEELLKIMVYLGNTYKELVMSEKAEKMLQEALKLCQQHFQQEPAKALSLLVSLAHIYRRLGDFAKAEDLCSQSLSLCKQHTPKDYASLAAIHMALCVAHREQGHYKKAEEHIHQSLGLYEQYLPDQQLDYAHALRLLGHVCSDQGLYKQARELYEKSLDIFLQHDQPNHPKALWLYAKLGTICRRLGEVDKAHSYLDQAENSNIFSVSPVVMGLTHHERAHLYLQQAKYDQALEEAQKSLGVYTQLYGNKHVKSRRALNLVGYVLMHKGDFDQAEECMIQALQTFGSKGLPLRCQALDYLSELYRRRTAQAKPDQEDSLRQKALEYINQAIRVAEEYFPSDSVHISHLKKQKERITETHTGTGGKKDKTSTKRCQ